MCSSIVRMIIDYLFIHLIPKILEDLICNNQVDRKIGYNNIYGVWKLFFYDNSQHSTALGHIKLEFKGKVADKSYPYPTVKRGGEMCAIK